MRLRFYQTGKEVANLRLSKKSDDFVHTF
jgi:hypothetical protein